MSSVSVSVGLRLPVYLHDKLVAYATQVQASKSEIIVAALANYLDNAEDVPISIKMADLEKRIVALETKVAR